MISSEAIQPRKQAKNVRRDLPRTGKMKRISERQKVEDLNQAAMNYEESVDSKNFEDLPISVHTKRGLKKAFFKKMTEIQLESLPVSLKGRDLLAAARTGSGKTLAFLVPVLEILYRKKWGSQDGLGALIISPTRELAVQIFNVLRSIGAFHGFSAGLIIGGKNLKDEKDRLARMNILVATPGRLLQHMDQTIGFCLDNLQMLVLDEADRILDMGFAKTLSALLAHLPKSRQTLLFSATQTSSVKDLARLSLEDPVSIGLSSDDTVSNPIPVNLEQHYAICALENKLSILFSFIRTHLQAKILVFLSSCKQVRFVFETFCKLHPGIPLMHLHGKQKQSARLTMFQKFTGMSNAVLFATDIAARGLDFPSVNWVFQVDVPEDAETYIHRVGRTARYTSAGKSLMLVLPSEEAGVLAALKRKGIVINAIKIRPSKTQDIQNRLQNLGFQDPEIKYLGQRAFVSYLRSIHVHRDKSIFKLEELPLEKFAASLGLPGAPKVKFFNKEITKQKKNASRALAEAEMNDVTCNSPKTIEGSERYDEDEEEELLNASSDEENDAVGASGSLKSVVRTKYDRMFERKNPMLAQYSKMVDHSDQEDPDSADEFITFKRINHELSEDDNDVLPMEDNKSKRKIKMESSKKALAKSSSVANKIIFDEAGKGREIYDLIDAEQFYKAGADGVKAAGAQFVQGEMLKLKLVDSADKMEAKEKKREKKRKRKEQNQEDAANTFTPEGVIAATYIDHGYITPEFDLSTDEDKEATHSAHRMLAKRPKITRAIPVSIEDEEELASSLLRGDRWLLKN